MRMGEGDENRMGWLGLGTESKFGFGGRILGSGNESIMCKERDEHTVISIPFLWLHWPNALLALYDPSPHFHEASAQ